MRISPVITLVTACFFMTIGGCDSLKSDEKSTSLSASTVLTSSTLSGTRPPGTEPAAKVSGTDILFAPDNLSGEILSFLFATEGQNDEGVVVFGDGRPDIAPNTAPLFPFDFLGQLAVNSSITLKPGFVGGVSLHAVAIFGYVDITVSAGPGGSQVVRVAMASINGMQRGDKLLRIGSSFQWYNLDSSSFTATRPNNPAAIEAIRDFSDPVRPNLVFYPLNVFLDSEVPMDASVLAASSSLDVVVNFGMAQAITLVGHTSLSVTLDDLITSFSLTQVTEGFGSSGLTASATVTPIP